MCPTLDSPRQLSVKQAERLADEISELSRQQWEALKTWTFLGVIEQGIPNVCEARHPTAWTLRQFREAIPSDHTYRFLIHDRDSIFSAEVDDELGAFGLKVLRTAVQAPKPDTSRHAYCRLAGVRPKSALQKGQSGYRRCASERRRIGHFRHNSPGVGHPVEQRTHPTQHQPRVLPE
jgi:hypothetical protein